MTSSILIVSYRRPEALRRCLLSLAAQRCRPGEVVVVWQSDDTPTRDAAQALRGEVPFPVRVVHSPEAGIVPAENRALDAATGEVVALIDDDVVVPPDWLARHLAYYEDPRVGAVGGPVENILPNGTRLSRRASEPLGRVTWYGRVFGNLHDHVHHWRDRPPRDVDHLGGGNLSLRRDAFDRFEAGLRRYWQLFEMDACLQVKANGYRVLFDFANRVLHYPDMETHATPGRQGDWDVKIFNPAYNRAFVLAKHSPWHLRPWRWAYLMAVGTADAPGPMTFPWALVRYGNPRREARILAEVGRQRLAGWAAGIRARPRSRGQVPSW
jgi:GT2 family glycosyltransferase